MPTERHTVLLTEEERNHASRKAAQLMCEYRRTEDRARETATDYREQMKALRAEADTAARAADTGRDEREIEVRREADNERFQIRTLRADTDEVVHTRPMTEDELRVARQGVLPLRQPSSVSPLRGNTRGGQPS